MSIKPQHTAERKNSVLQSVVRCRNNKAKICRYVDIHRDTLYEWLYLDANFNEQYERQLEILKKLKLLEKLKKAKQLLEKGKFAEALSMIYSGSPELEEKLARFQKLKKQANLKKGFRY